MAVEKPTGYLVFPSAVTERQAVYLNPDQMQRALSQSLEGKRTLPDPTRARRVISLYGKRA